MTSVDASPPRVRRHGARASGPTRARGGLAATMMMAGRSRGVPSRPAKDGAGPAKTEDLEDFLQRRDWAGATTLLEHRRSFPGPDGEGSSSTTLEWLAYAHFHAGNPHKALELYRALLREPDPDPTHHVFAAACLFYLGRHDDAAAEAEKGPDTKLRTRVLMHCAHKKGDEALLMRYHAQLSDSVEDQLSLASVHTQRGHHQEAVDIYKRLLLDDREKVALNVYVALCYHKLEYFDVSCELLEAYLNEHPRSPVAVNLKACNTLKLRDGAAAELELATLTRDDEVARDASSSPEDANDLVRHNRAVFRDGDGAVRVFKPLMLNGDVPPEARLNLVIHYLKQNEPYEALALVENLEPATPHEYVLKGVTHASVGQTAGDSTTSSSAREHLKLAQQCFQIVGSSASECDTIPGRQSMASCFHLLDQHEDALVYLKSVAEFSKDDDDFHWNFGMCAAASGDWRAGEEELSRVSNGAYREELSYKTWLAKCFVRNGKAASAWALCEETAAAGDDDAEDGAAERAAESLAALLRVVADACYEIGEYYVAMRAFDELERLEDTDAFWEGKRGAAVGVFANVLAGKEQAEILRDVVTMLRQSPNATDADAVAEPMLEWARGEGLRLE